MRKMPKMKTIKELLESMAAQLNQGLRPDTNPREAAHHLDAAAGDLQEARSLIQRNQARPTGSVVVQLLDPKPPQEQEASNEGEL